jgi:hypothetical protein
VLKKPYKPTDVAIQNVTRFAYAQMDDGAYTLWALGEAGWFTIAGPAGHYQSTHDEDVQAVELLYFLIDCYTETPRKKGGGPSASLLYREVSGQHRPMARIEQFVLNTRSTPRNKSPGAEVQQTQSGYFTSIENFCS